MGFQEGNAACLAEVIIVLRMFPRNLPADLRVAYPLD